MLLQNISKSPYFLKCCEKLTDWNTLVDEIYYEVQHLEPWTAGAHRSPSTAFCLLLRLFTLRCTEKQMILMLDHVDSPYIRCIGLLYLRYAADPGSLWSWFEPYLHDEEAVQVQQGKTETTLGKYAQSLLSNLEYYGTRLPRLPLAIERQFKVKLLQAERIEERAKRHFKNQAAMDYFQKVGARVQALYGDDENPITWYGAVVEKVVMRDGESGKMVARPKFQVYFPEYGNTEIVSLGEIDLPGIKEPKTPAEASKSYDSRGNRDRGKGYDDSRRSDRGIRGRGNYGHRGDYYDYSERDARGSRGYADERGSRGYPDERGSRGYADERGSRGYPDERSRSRYESHSGIDRYHPSERNPSHERSQSRDRSRSRDRGDNLNDARREEKELMEEVLRRERDKTASKGRAYAARPATFKESLGTPGAQSRHLAQDSDWRPRGNSTKAKGEKNAKSSSKPAAAPVVQKTAAELAAIEEKKRKLVAKYG